MLGNILGPIYKVSVGIMLRIVLKMAFSKKVIYEESV